MSSIKDALVRIGRSIRHFDFNKAITNHSNPSKSRPKSYNENHFVDQSQIDSNENALIPGPLHHSKISNEKLKKYYPLVSKDYQRKYYQDFLKPLGIPNLKTFQQDRPKYNSTLAHENWQRSKALQNISNSNSGSSLTASKFLEDRIHFMRMMDLLIKITPDYLKLDQSANPQYIERILQVQENQELENKYPHLTPKYHFHEVPPIPNPLEMDTKTFSEYIYFLTHSNIHYKNSQSLENGLIPDILLYTHNLSNHHMKKFRSTNSFNHLIKFFGYDKNQSSFARELLLVMHEDGHKPNIDTINNLLKMCRTHSHIRSLTSTYSIVSKYLKLSQSLGIDITLTTWSRVYDSINNIFLKEIFIDKMNSINLPISRNMILRILDDYMKTTKDTNLIINFIENDLKQNDWKNDSQIANKVFKHRLENQSIKEGINYFFNELKESNQIIDEYTYQYLMQFIAFHKNITNDNNDKHKLNDQQNEITNDRIYLMLSAYSTLLFNYPKIEFNPNFYKYLIRGICIHSHNHDLGPIMLILRGLIHEDCTRNLGLPIEFNRININGKSSQIEVEGPSENFKIMRRIVGPLLNELEGRYLYTHGFKWSRRTKYKNERAGCSLDNDTIHSKLLRNPLTTKEKEQWELIKHTFAQDNSQLSVKEEHSKLVGIIKDYETTKKASIQGDNYARDHKKRSVAASVRERLSRMHLGSDAYVKKRMEERGILVHIKETDNK
ncbi:hypothetical protein CAAN1_18S03224 [[Candida] anglica]|uniref:ATPase expression protein 3 n=1 Tax=[Candida] anglica TaxID=148631 RepID=A0ABP0EM21_9ASCO